MPNYDPNELAQVLVQRGGYNPTDAANISTTSRGAELAREFKISSYQPTQQDFFQEQTRLRQEAIKPAITSLEASLPEICQKY